MIRSLRLRLTLWYLAFFSLLLAAFSVFLYGLLARTLRDRLDERLSAGAETAAGLFRAELEELNGDAPAAAAETITEMRPQAILVAFFADGRFLASSSSGPVKQLEMAAARVWGQAETALVVDVPELDGHAARAATRRFTAGNVTCLAMAGQSTESIYSDLRGFRDLLFGALPLLLAVAGLGGYALATRSLAPLNAMAAQAREITSSSLDRRLAVGAAAGELRLLAASFNELLSRLDRSFETMRRFVADASHELRTPLAVIRGETDVALARDRNAAEYRETLGVVQDEARRLSRLVEDLLSLARADAGRVNLKSEILYVDDLVAECCRSVQPAAGAHNITLRCRAPEDVSFQGDEGLLRRMVLNLLDNAVRYTPAGGRVDVALRTEDRWLRIDVTDNGMGIPPQDAPHVFERFYRADKARSRNEGGFGLGLSIVKWVAEAHRGTVSLTSEPGAGSTFSVFLPR
ncbi:MAG: heavy metal sensor histidine kinase [Bryobacterales bacterium]|nr:heavy metal sensor histidine kinase [Bryobacterales bacterium]